MGKVKVIPIHPKYLVKRYKKVAAYCRVSTAQELQYHSLEAQREYFEKYISERTWWVFVGIYADQASGRHNLRMKEFQRMMADCRAGKIDLILVKSISRLGRNTVQFLQACNELNSLCVDVYFEVEKLYISNPKAVRMLTVYASVYQNESETKSFSIHWGHLVRFQDGNSKFYNRPCYEYRQAADGALKIVSVEAAVVTLIYEWRAEGASLRTIASRLMEMNIKSPRGGKVWGIETIRKILNILCFCGIITL